MVIPSGLLADVVAHAQRDAPDECCGLISVRDGTAVGVHALENLAHSPMRFEVDGRELLGILRQGGEGPLPEIVSRAHDETLLVAPAALAKPPVAPRMFLSSSGFCK